MVESHGHEEVEDLIGRAGFGARLGPRALEDEERHGGGPRRPLGASPRAGRPDRGDPGRCARRSRSIPTRCAAGRERTSGVPRGAATDAPVLLDAYALIAHLRDEPAAGEVSKLLRRRACEISAVNLAEVLDQLLRVSRVSPARLEAALAPLLGEVIRVRSVEERDAAARRSSGRPITTGGRGKSRSPIAFCSRPRAPTRRSPLRIGPWPRWHARRGSKWWRWYPAPGTAVGSYGSGVNLAPRSRS